MSRKWIVYIGNHLSKLQAFKIAFSNFDTSWNQTDLYWYQTSFDKKYDHFSLLCKQMDIYLRKVYIVRKVTSAPTFLPFAYMLDILVCVMYIACDEF